MSDRHEMEAIIEAVLFVSHDPVSRSRLVESFPERQRETAKEAVEAVVDRFSKELDRGVMIDEVAGGLRLVTRPDLHGYLRRFFESSSQHKLTMPALETLAIIAYRQPVTAPEIQELRGVSSTGVVKKLLERRLIRIAGRKEVVGKPFLYGTTREFLMHFGLKSLKDLPPLEQFEELFGDEIEAEVPDEPLEPDQEEQIEKEAAELDEAEDAAVEQTETEAVDEEREAAEATELANDTAPAVEEAPDDEPEPAEASDDEPGERDEPAEASDDESDERDEPAEASDDESDERDEPAEASDDEPAESAESAEASSDESEPEPEAEPADDAAVAEKDATPDEELVEA